MSGVDADVEQLCNNLDAMPESLLQSFANIVKQVRLLRSCTEGSSLNLGLGSEFESSGSCHADDTTMISSHGARVARCGRHGPWLGPSAGFRSKKGLSYSPECTAMLTS